MKIAIGSDHAGYLLKEDLKLFIKGLGYEDVKDFGCNNEESVDYPDFARVVAEEVAKNVSVQGILICGSGIGMSIAANKISGIRAALCYNITTSRLAREHNDANVLCLGARLIKPALAKEIVRIFLTTGWQGGHHAVRVTKISALESCK